MKKLLNWIWKKIFWILLGLKRAVVAVWNFLKSIFFFRILGAVVIAASILFDEILTEEEYPRLKIFLAILTGVLFLFFDPIADQISRFRMKRKRKTRIESNLKPLLKFLEKHLEIKLDQNKMVTEIGDADIDYEKIEHVYGFTINQVSQLTEPEKDATLLTALCNQIEGETDVLKIDRYKSTVAAIFEKYDFLDFDDNAKTVIRFYKNFQQGKKLSSPNTSIDFMGETNGLTKKYNKSHNLSLQLKLEKDQAQEFRRTLAILIRDGKLNVKALEKNLQKRINRELENRADSSRALLVLANKFHKIEGVKRVLDKFPRIVYPYKQPHNLPESIRYLHTRIIYPSGRFTNAEEFLKEEIIPQIPNDKLNDGFLAIIPIEGTELYSVPDNVDKIDKDHLKEGFESINAYKTGVSLNLAELYMESMKDEINVDEILSNIPFNIFVPGISERNKNFLIAKYDDLKQNFNITRLADWANINREDLRDYLIQLDNDREKKRLYSDDNWEEAANTIVDQAIKHRNAINN